MEIINHSNWMKYNLFGEKTVTVDLTVKLSEEEANALQSLLKGESPSFKIESKSSGVE